MLLDKIKIALQYALPKHALSRMTGKFAAAQAGWLTTTAIKLFIKHYQINMAEAEQSDPATYPTFNQFFTRPLKAGAREIATGDLTIVHPVDGTISQLGDIDNDTIFQAKGHNFSLTTLLGGDSQTATPFFGGEFATVYLAPKDYHRIHMPMTGVVKEMIYIPGDLFSVNPLTAQNVPNLFARNERVAVIFDTEHGPLAMVLVGATIVASIETVWAGNIAPPIAKTRDKQVTRWTYDTEGPNRIKLHKGQEMGRFKLGSTIVAVFPKNQMRFLANNQAGKVTRMGEHFGDLYQ